jgi:actin-related protein
VELLIEDFGVPALCLAASTEASYLSVSENSGIIVDIGDTQTTATVVYERHVIASKSTSGLAGRWVSYHLYDLIKDKQKGNELTDRYSLLGGLNNWKEQHCYVATPNFEAECQLHLEKPSLKKQVDISGLFPSEGSEKITLAAERFIAPDLLFNPSLDDKDSLGIQHLIYDVLMESHPTMRPFLTSNIQLVGGTSRLAGLTDRLKFELNWMEEDLFSTSHIELLHPNTEWLGSSLLSSLSDFPSLLETKDQFLERGIIGRKLKSP